MQGEVLPGHLTAASHLCVFSFFAQLFLQPHHSVVPWYADDQTSSQHDAQRSDHFLSASGGDQRDCRMKAVAPHSHREHPAPDKQDDVMQTPGGGRFGLRVWCCAASVRVRFLPGLETH